MSDLTTPLPPSPAATLAAFAGALRREHLEAVAFENIRRARELAIPALAHFSHLSEAALLEFQMGVSDQLLAAFEAGRAQEEAEASLRRWREDRLPAGVPRDGLTPEDLILIAAAQKQTLLTFVPRFTQNPAEVLTIVTALEAYYTHTQLASFGYFTQLREEAARAWAEKAAAEAYAEELQAANEELSSQAEELMAQQEELQAQQEELEQLNTELQQANDALRRQNEAIEAEVARRTERLREADRYKDEFLSVISHEMRTPLNFIVSFASVLDDEVAGALNATQHGYLAKILNGADRMLLLVNNLLDMGRMQAGKFLLAPDRVFFAPLVEEVISTLAPLAAPKHVVLETAVATPGPVWLDSQRIIQVLTNLVDNAIKFTPEHGRITVRAAVSDGTLRCEIEDTGVGIAPEDIDKLFSRFTQLDMSSTRRVGGTGLGLSIAKGLIEAHGGTIGVSSTPGVGSVFYFELPVEGQAL